MTAQAQKTDSARKAESVYRLILYIHYCGGRLLLLAKMWHSAYSWPDP